jgi:hypothetical protein
MSIETLKEYRHADPIESIMAGIEADGGVIVRDFIPQELLQRPVPTCQTARPRSSGVARPSASPDWPHARPHLPSCSIMT